MSTIHVHKLEHRHLAYSWSHGPHPRPLIVLHGLGDSAIHTYAPRFASTVLRNTPAIFIDLPGFGEATASSNCLSTIEAMADDVVQLLSALNVAHAPIFAHSMGANIAITLAAKYPTIGNQLILAEPLLHPDDSVLAAGIAKHSEEAFIARGYSMLVRATSLQAHRGEEAATAFLPVLKLASPVAMHRAAISLLRDREPTLLSLLHNLQSPTTLLLGERTNHDISGVEHGNIRVNRVPNAGHFLMVEAAATTACVILDLVTGMHNGRTSS